MNAEELQRVAELVTVAKAVGEAALAVAPVLAGSAVLRTVIPNRKYVGTVKFLIGVIDLLALNFGHAKNAPPKE